MRSWPVKFELNPINSLSAYALKLLNQSEVMKRWNSVERNQKLTRLVELHNELDHNKAVYSYIYII